MLKAFYFIACIISMLDVLANNCNSSALDERKYFNYIWSPDSQYLAFMYYDWCAETHEDSSPKNPEIRKHLGFYGCQEGITWGVTEGYYVIAKDLEEVFICNSWGIYRVPISGGVWKLVRSNFKSEKYYMNYNQTRQELTIFSNYLDYSVSFTILNAKDGSIKFTTNNVLFFMRNENPIVICQSDKDELFITYLIEGNTVKCELNLELPQTSRNIRLLSGTNVIALIPEKIECTEAFNFESQQKIEVIFCSLYDAITQSNKGGLLYDIGKNRRGFWFMPKNNDRVFIYKTEAQNDTNFVQQEETATIKDASAELCIVKTFPKQEYIANVAINGETRWIYSPTEEKVAPWHIKWIPRSATPALNILVKDIISNFDGIDPSRSTLSWEPPHILCGKDIQNRYFHIDPRGKADLSCKGGFENSMSCFDKTELKSSWFKFCIKNNMPCFRIAARATTKEKNQTIQGYFYLKGLDPVGGRNYPYWLDQPLIISREHYLGSDACLEIAQQIIAEVTNDNIPCIVECIPWNLCLYAIPLGQSDEQTFFILSDDVLLKVDSGNNTITRMTSKWYKEYLISPDGTRVALIGPGNKDNYPEGMSIDILDIKSGSLKNAVPFNSCYHRFCTIAY